LNRQNQVLLKLHIKGIKSGSPWIDCRQIGTSGECAD
jgi:hypothetical protein